MSPLRPQFFVIFLGLFFSTAGLSAQAVLIPGGVRPINHQDDAERLRWRIDGHLISSGGSVRLYRSRAQEATEVSLVLLREDGQPLVEVARRLAAGQFSITIQLPELEPGNYLLQMRNTEGILWPLLLPQPQQ